MRHQKTFLPINLNYRIYIKDTQNNHVQERLGEHHKKTEKDVDEELIERIFEIDPIPQIVVTPAGRLILANEKARWFFNLEMDDLGRYFRDFKLSYSPIELRSLIDSVTQTGKGLEVKNVEFESPEGEKIIFNIQLKSVENHKKEPKGISIIFLDVTRDRQLQWDLEKANDGLQAAYEELQTTNEELETTNEELHTTIEEVETTNEELQSTNEELETMNEELQSTNDELRTTNLELEQRTNQLKEANAFRQSILSNLKEAVITTDLKMRITSWNREAEELWGLREDEVEGKNLLPLDIGFPVEKLKGTIQDCLSGEKENIEKTYKATNRRGKSIQCLTTCRPLMDHSGKINGVIIMMEDVTE